MFQVIVHFSNNDRGDWHIKCQSMLEAIHTVRKQGGWDNVQCEIQYKGFSLWVSQWGQRGPTKSQRKALWEAERNIPYCESMWYNIAGCAQAAHLRRYDPVYSRNCLGREGPEFWREKFKALRLIGSRIGARMSGTFIPGQEYIPGKRMKSPYSWSPKKEEISNW